MAEHTMTATAKYGATPLVLADGAVTPVPATILEGVTIIPGDRVRLAVRTPLEPFITGTEARTTYAAYMLAAIAPAAWWRLGEASGHAQDSSGNGYHMTSSGNCTYSQTGALVGDSNTAIYFPGTAWQSIADTAALDPDYNEDFFIGMWIKWTGTATGKYPIAKWDAAVTNIPYIIQLAYEGYTTGKLLFTVRDASSHLDLLATNAALNDGAWHLVIARRTGTTIQWFVDGVWETGAAQTVNTTTTNAIGTVFGCAAGGANLFTGYLDEVFFKKGTIVDEQASTLYYLGKQTSPWS